jgi:4-amino-4-deoxy-L-arabinose transferase-like glycosyltransferase
MLLLLLVLTLGIRLVCFTGLIASDDLGYSGFAQQVANGTYHVYPHHYATRYGVLLPLAALYRLFGVHEWTTVALPLAASTLAVALAAILAMRLFGSTAAWIAAFLLATFPVDIRYASILVPEGMLQAVVLAGGLLFVLGERRGSQVLIFLAGVVWGCAYLVKEPGIFVPAAFMLFAMWRKQWKTAVALGLGVALVISSEAGWYLIESGDMLFRSHAMVAHNGTPQAMEANQNLRYRLLEMYPQMMLIPNRHFGLHAVAALALAAWAVFRYRSAKLALLLLWAIVPFLYLNFGSSSFSAYWALPAAPRYIGFVYAPLFIIAGGVLAGWMTSPRREKRTAAGALLALISVVGVVSAVSTRRTGYGTESVQQLRSIAAQARAEGYRVCEFAGPGAANWRTAMRILEPQILGCQGNRTWRIVPGQDGSPAAIPEE